MSEGRVLRAVRGLAGEPFEFGPIGSGPAKVAKVRATGVIGEATCERLAGEEVNFRLSIPVTLELEIAIGVDRHRFDADVTVGLTLRARAAAPLRVVIEIEDPTWRDVDVDVRAGSRRASVLQVVSGMDREIRRFIARYVRRELDKPHIREARDIDVAARIDGAWSG